MARVMRAIHNPDFYKLGHRMDGPDKPGHDELGSE
jgi:hypothetical protein